jgi:hypothetical protein
VNAIYLKQQIVNPEYRRKATIKKTALHNNNLYNFVETKPV